jgi:hypothetical protein
VNSFPDVFDAAWRPAAGLVAGHDVLGGVFALNGRDPAAEGRLGAPGQMTYFAPDTLRWEPMDISYPAWVSWLLSGRLAKFHEALRWPGWQEGCDACRGLRGFRPRITRQMEGRSLTLSRVS